jgi:hypothetical protein
MSGREDTMPAQLINHAERVFGMFKTMLLIREFEEACPSPARRCSRTNTG